MNNRRTFLATLLALPLAIKSVVASKTPVKCDPEYAKWFREQKPISKLTGKWDNIYIPQFRIGESKR